MNEKDKKTLLLLGIIMAGLLLVAGNMEEPTWTEPTCKNVQISSTAYICRQEEQNIMSNIKNAILDQLEEGKDIEECRIEVKVKKCQNK